MNKGKWLLKTHSFLDGYKVHISEAAVCSNCGKELKGKEYTYHFDQPPIKMRLLSKELKAIKPHLKKYCPHCGTKMKKRLDPKYFYTNIEDKYSPTQIKLAEDVEFKLESYKSGRYQREKRLKLIKELCCESCGAKLFDERTNSVQSFSYSVQDGKTRKTIYRNICQDCYETLKEKGQKK